MISICMCTYNSSRYLRPQLDSLLNQTDKDYEVIIVDDASSDATPEMVKDYIKENNLSSSWTFYENEENLGYAKNFAKALSLAKGEIVALCDHDDVWHKDKLETLHRLFENESIDFIGTSFDEIDKDGKKLNKTYSRLTSNNGKIKYKVKKGKMKRLSFKQIFTYPFTPGCTMAFRRKYVDELVNDIEIAPHDYLISCYFASKKKCMFYNVSLIDYRLHDSNKIGLPDLSNVDERIRICDKDILEKEDIIANLRGILSKSDIKYALKHVSLLKERKEELSSGKIKLALVIKAFFQKKYYFTILKDKKVLKK